ncbi:MAG: GTP cyclohydrolase I FolE [Candidatus Binatia bacterium]|nr:GTP cyclohydrolase I FolE [Candidatus Binatia bacterium]
MRQALLKHTLKQGNNKRSGRHKHHDGVVGIARGRSHLNSGIEEHVRQILLYMGEDPDREGLVKTPARVARAFEYLTKGYSQDPKEVIGRAMFTEEDYQEMVLVKDIDFFSLCEHHILPFFGRAHVAYIPKHRIVGLSKIPRLVEVFARRLQVQERLTTQIANTLMEELDPLGVGVIIRAEHLCMRMRGVEKQNSIVTTSAMLGAFRTHQETREEFIILVNGGQR